MGKKVTFSLFPQKFENGPFLAHFDQNWPKFGQNDQFSSFPEKNKNVTFLHSLRLAFMQKIREIQCAVF